MQDDTILGHEVAGNVYGTDRVGQDTCSNVQEMVRRDKRLVLMGRRPAKVCRMPRQLHSRTTALCERPMALLKTKPSLMMSSDRDDSERTS